MSKERILEKIQKCLNLSKSSNAGEAANALRQAQAMMRQHEITEKDITGIGYGNEAVSIPVQATNAIPLYLSKLNALIRKAFGVDSVIELEVRVSDESYRMRFFGPTDRVLLASYAYTVCFRALMSGWTQHLKDNPRLKGVRGARTGFLVGWIAAVETTVTEFGFTDVERAATTLVKTDHYGKALAKVGASKISMLNSTIRAGNAAGSEFRLHRPITPSFLKIGQ